MVTNNDFIEIKKWQFWDIYPKIIGDDASPITNTEEWERWVEPVMYRSHLIALVHEPKLDPWKRPMLPYVSEFNETPIMWGQARWPNPPLKDMDADSCMTITSVNGFAVKLYRRKADWKDPWHRAECRELGLTLTEYYDIIKTNENEKMAIDYWDLNEVLDKYPIRNDGEWKFTGNLIKSTIKFNDINSDPWFRDFTESKKTFISDEAGILIYGYTTIQNKRVRLWSC